MRVEHIGLATLYLADCSEVLPSLQGVDVVISDPPYGINFKPATRSTKENDKYAGGSFKTEFVEIKGDDQEFDPTPFLRWPCVLWGANNYAHRLPASNGWLVWYKSGGIEGFRMSECEMAWTNVLNSTKHFDHMWHGFKRASENGDKVLPPTQKPVALMEWCIAQAKVAQDATILDPYMGAGSTGIAAVKMGRRFVGCEIEMTYFETACQRIEAAQQQMALFEHAL